jgi:hypothetical protein
VKLLRTIRLDASDTVVFRPAAEPGEWAVPGTMIALHREAGAEGEIRERFRTLRPRAETSLGAERLRGHARAFDIVETDGPEAPAVDLAAMLRARR